MIFYGVMKGRLDLENFSGQTPEAVRQDFHATLLLCNLESLLSGPAQAALTQHHTAGEQTLQESTAPTAITR